MKLTAELSLYPLQDEYIPVIQAFIETALAHRAMESGARKPGARKPGAIEIITNAMSTQICGEYDQVFELVRDCLAASYHQHGKQVLMCKFIPWELDLTG